MKAFGFLVRRISALEIAAGLISGGVTVGIDIGLIALLLNFAVTYAVSAMAKNKSLHAPIAASNRLTIWRAKGEPHDPQQ